MYSGCEIRLRNLWFGSRFWKTASRNCFFCRKLQINFFWWLNIFLAKLLYLLCALLYCAYEWFISVRKILKTKLIAQVKQKVLFSNNVHIEGTSKNIILTHTKRNSRNRADNKIDSRIHSAGKMSLPTTPDPHHLFN